MKPIVKWAGGKRRLYKEIIERLPNKFNDYLEPFLGGGSIFLKLASENKIKKAFINDLNKELINVYKTVKTEPETLISKLLLLEEEHVKNKNCYYDVRARHNKLIKNCPEIDNIQAAANFIYLNKAGYNGLYRVNLRGEFNVPSGKKTSLRLFEEENLRNISYFLNKNSVDIHRDDYRDFVINNVKKGDFVYLDPPYDREVKDGMFTQYQKEGFSRKDQDALLEMCKYIHQIGAYFIQSNSATEYVKNAYRDYNVEVISVRRFINPKSGHKRVVEEVIIKNY